MYWLIGLLHCSSLCNSSGYLYMEWFDSQTLLQGKARKGSSRTHPTLPFQMLIISRIPNHQMRNRVILLFWNLFRVEVRSGFFHIQFHVFQKIMNIYNIWTWVFYWKIYWNDIIDKLMREIVENKPLGSCMFFMNFTSGIFSSKTLVYM